MFYKPFRTVLKPTPLNYKYCDKIFCAIFFLTLGPILLTHYCIYSTQLTGELLADLHLYGAAHIEMHLARVRFNLDIQSNPGHAVLFLKYSNCIHDISHETDHALGQ